MFLIADLRQICNSEFAKYFVIFLVKSFKFLIFLLAKIFIVEVVWKGLHMDDTSSELVGEWSQSSHMGDTYSELVVEWSQDSHMGDTYSELVVKWSQY